MADLVIGDKDVEKIGVCPYDGNHRIKMKKMEAHMEKCRGRNRPVYYVKCPYNATHVKFKEEMALHLELCPDKYNFGKIADIDSFIAPKSCINREIESRDVLGDEDWDEEERPLTYDPEDKLSDVRFQPKNFQKRKEKIYYPNARTVVASCANYSYPGQGIPNQEIDYDNSKEMPTNTYEDAQNEGAYWDDENYDLDFAEEQAASISNVKSWFEKNDSRLGTGAGPVVGSFSDEEALPLMRSGDVSLENGESGRASSTSLREQQQCSEFQEFPAVSYPNKNEHSRGSYWQSLAASDSATTENKRMHLGGVASNPPMQLEEIDEFDREFAEQNNAKLYRRSFY